MKVSRKLVIAKDSTVSDINRKCSLGIKVTTCEQIHFLRPKLGHSVCELDQPQCKPDGIARNSLFFLRCFHVLSKHKPDKED